MTAERRVLITGASGTMGRILLDRPERQGWSYVLFDPVAPEIEGLADRGDIAVVTGDVSDAQAVASAMQGVTDVVHLGALSVEDYWEDILRVNIGGTRNLLEAAAAQGVGRFVFASSNHAVGCYTPSDAGPAGLADDAEARPDTYYGWSKAAGEDLLRLYCERTQMRGVVIRIGHCFPEPLTGPRLPFWLSPRDARALLDACLENDIAPFQTVWGSSANTRSWLSLEGGKKIGFVSADDSEQFVDRFPADSIAIDPDGPLGAHFVSVPLGVPMRTR
ncbi:NAD(P)-dependent oxidoreductase [Leucobacter coleopterorum]|uniref:NAD(P)-dependent oxidoreductase n=1 Tax=Leucobacter coleopterorum TaxID=2714933 RepID=A0ABX6JXG3_9MICO|nr:NAD(P)-dependent oxidoreductase [Leucobacter coleopterorum]QIM17614.1 NAD(P)-dependent oxidoreductase [Leucobacter coleopterorum]